MKESTSCCSASTNRPREEQSIPSAFREGVLDELGSSDDLARDMFRAGAGRLPAQLIEHAVQQVGPILVNQADFVFLVEHNLGDPIRQRRAA